MVGDSAGLRQQADAAKQTFASMSQKAGALQGKADRASDNDKMSIEGQLEALKGQIAGAMGEVNRTSAEYSSSVAQERTEELMAAVKEDETRVEQEEKKAKEVEEKEHETTAKKSEKPEVHNDDLLFLSEAFGTAGTDPTEFSKSGVGVAKPATEATNVADKKDETATKAVGGSGAAST